MIMQVHDELVFEANLEVADVAAEEIKNIMESVMELSVPLKVEVGLASNWDEAH
jgi:DNA polymerase-1